MTPIVELTTNAAREAVRWYFAPVASLARWLRGSLRYEPERSAAESAATSLFSSGTAKQSALQALVTTTRSCVLLMTEAGIAYDVGAFGAPGSVRAEETWSKIAEQSLQMGAALNDWTAAIKGNKDSSAYSSIVAQAFAVIGALLPAVSRSDLRRLGDQVPRITEADVPVSIERLGNPWKFRAWPQQLADGRAR